MSSITSHQLFSLHHQFRPSDQLNPLTGTHKLWMGRMGRKEIYGGFDRGFSKCSMSNQRRVQPKTLSDEKFEANNPLEEIKQRIHVIRKSLQNVDNGEISVSAYDTAWVALIRDIHGVNAPQFPSTLDWIINNQLDDGSWGDAHFFSAYDRLICTLACVIALKRWSITSECLERGILSIRKNVHKLKYEDREHQLSCFEILFPSLLGMAQNLGLEILQDSTILEDLYAKQERMLKRIPKEKLHNESTTLLYSLEGLHDLDWEKLLKLQHPNGSFLCSPSSTACAFIHSKDEKCLKYLQDTVERFKGGVPHSYPVDLYERLWMVDRFDRLGFSRYLMTEVKEYLDYVYRFWTPNGISWSRDTSEHDIDDTSMGFRLLRLHGYDVKACAFEHFRRDNQFYCFLGQTSQGISEMLSLYRASQVLFPGETTLDDAKHFSYKVIEEKLEQGQDADRWLITEKFIEEVQYYMDFPWYTNLPRIETRYYIDQYGGDRDVWIAKVLNRMYNISNNRYLELAKLDYNHCQKLHQQEWIDIQRWYNECHLSEFGLTNDNLLESYFLAMSNIFEPERVAERLAWAHTSALIEVVYNYYKTISMKQKKAFINLFSSLSNNRESNSNGLENKLGEAILQTLNGISQKVHEVHGIEVYRNLKQAWHSWLLNLETQEENNGVVHNEAELLVCTINWCSGNFTGLDNTHPIYAHLTGLTNVICNTLRPNYNSEDGSRMSCVKKMMTKTEAESQNLNMEELVRHVVKRGDGIDQNIKQSFLSIAKSYYYVAYNEPATIKLHISKVLFQTII